MELQKKISSSRLGIFGSAPRGEATNEKVMFIISNRNASTYGLVLQCIDDRKNWYRYKNRCIFRCPLSPKYLQSV